MHFCCITCPFQYISSLLHWERPNSPAPLANNIVLWQTIKQKSLSKNSSGKVTSQNLLVKVSTIASGIKEWMYVIAENGFGKVLVLQHPKGLLAGLGALFCIRII